MFPRNNMQCLAHYLDELLEDTHTDSVTAHVRIKDLLKNNNASVRNELLENIK